MKLRNSETIRTTFIPTINGFTNALQWWEEWQLRILVLGSLAVQYLLAIFGGRRKFHIPPWYRLFIWLSYLGSDALAIYALATLFSRQKKVHYNNGSRDLEVVWAPILLIHLGGQMFITAYNMEDNELWKRHIVTAVSQITVALYVFCKSWSSSADRRLFVAEIWLFIIGIVKCFEKPMALKAASFSSLVNNTKYHHAERANDESREEELELFVKNARDSIIGISSLDMNNINTIFNRLLVPKGQFLDSTLPYPVRLDNLKYFLSGGWVSAYNDIQDGLSNIFNFFYTRNKFTNRQHASVAEYCFMSGWPLTLALAMIPAIGLLHSSHKQAYSHNDVIVTFVMLYGTLLVHIISALIIFLSAVDLEDDIPQQSLIGFYAHNKRHRWSLSIVDYLQCKPLLDQYWQCIKPCNNSMGLTELVYDHVKQGWIEHIHDAESYRTFNDNMGWLALERAGCNGVLGWSLEKPFDETVLLWHLATDFCYHNKPLTTDDASCMEMGRVISNYMTHLLFANPEMLMAGSRKNLFMEAAYKELEGILKDEKNLHPYHEEKLAQLVFSKVMKSEDHKVVKSKDHGSFIRDAGRLAQGLMDLGDEKKMWRVIRDVWVQMLCFSAGRCRGYLHAKSRSGVEYLSFVWLLLLHAGMETFADRLQRRHQLRNHLPKDQEPSDSKDLKPLNHKEEDNNAAPLAHQGEGTIVPELKEIIVSP
uniref:DUF4220 domain-containing protein n=1 Tax=Leersia perrieri TaxID=77586 RepID=A0A0D9X4C1_9ORYZ